MAELIGLLHDIGRFEQLKKYDSFEDKSTVDHAKLGVEILTANNNKLLTKFCPDTSYHYTIIKAISNHNKYEIEDGIEGNVLTHCKIIRDADKIDILNLYRFEKFETLYKVKKIENEDISKEVYNSVFENRTMKRDEVKTNIDDWIYAICLVYNIYYKPSMKILEEKDYLNELIDRVESNKNHEKLLNIRNHINEYMKEINR